MVLTCAVWTSVSLRGLVLLVWLRQRLPAFTDLRSLTLVSLGCVVGFPLFTALALQHITSAHSIVFIGLLPLCTAVFAVLRGGERPRAAFWLFSVLGSAFVIGYAALDGIEASLQGSS